MVMMGLDVNQWLNEALFFFKKKMASLLWISKIRNNQNIFF
jgi:hypothetical protein